MGFGVVPLDGAAINPINLHRLSGFAGHETGVLFLDGPGRREATGGHLAGSILNWILRMPQLSRGAHKCADEIDVLGALSLSAGSASAECSRVCPFMWCRQLDEHLSWTAPGKVWRVVLERSSLGPTGKHTPAFSSPSKPSVVRRGYKRVLKGNVRGRIVSWSNWGLQWVCPFSPTAPTV